MITAIFRQDQQLGIPDTVIRLQELPRQDDLITCPLYPEKLRVTYVERLWEMNECKAGSDKYQIVSELFIIWVKPAYVSDNHYSLPRGQK